MQMVKKYTKMLKSQLIKKMNVKLIPLHMH